jgi:hypothetical protein
VSDAELWNNIRRSPDVRWTFFGHLRKAADRTWCGSDDFQPDAYCGRCVIAAVTESDYGSPIARWWRAYRNPPEPNWRHTDAACARCHEPMPYGGPCPSCLIDDARGGR